MNIALRDCGIVSVALVGVALEIGIEPSARHAADLGYIPIVVTDACGAGHPGAAERSLESLKFAGDAVFTDVTTISGQLKAANKMRYQPGSHSELRQLSAAFSRNAALGTLTS